MRLIDCRFLGRLKRLTGSLESRSLCYILYDTTYLHKNILSLENPIKLVFSTIHMIKVWVSIILFV